MDKIKEASKEPGNDYGFFVEDVRPADKDYELVDAPEKDLIFQQQEKNPSNIPSIPNIQNIANNGEHKDLIHGEGVKESQKETDFKPLKGNNLKLLNPATPAELFCLRFS